MTNHTLKGINVVTAGVALLAAETCIRWHCSMDAAQKMDGGEGLVRGVTFE